LPRKVRKRKPRAVIDTSVLVAGISGFREPFVPGRNPSADVIHKWAERRNFVWHVTEDILEEYKEVLKRLSVRPNLIGRVVNLVRERTEEVKVRAPSQISPDPKDDAFCLCAESGKADFLITLNPRDFPQARLKTRVLLPGEFDT